MGNPGLAGGGGLFQNSNGDWVGAFLEPLGIITSIQTKLRALKDGLVLAIKLEIPNLEIEMDSSVAIELIKSTSTTNVFLSVVVGDCRCFMERFEHFTLKHIFREANGFADVLAKASCAQ